MYSFNFPEKVLSTSISASILTDFCLYTLGFLTQYQHVTQSTFLVKPCFFYIDHFNLSKKNLVFKGFFRINLDKSWIKFVSYLFKSLTSIQDDLCWFSESVVIISVLLICAKKFFTLLSFCLSSITSGSLSHSSSLISFFWQNRIAPNTLQ